MHEEMKKQQEIIQTKEINYDPDIIRNIWYYIRPEEDVPSDDMIKKLGFELICDF